MNQEIQQVKTNRKLRTYVSWKIALLNSIGLFVSMLLTAVLSDQIFMLIEGRHKVPEMTGLINFLLFGIPFVLILLGLFVWSIFSKPRGYIRRMALNTALFFSLFIPASLFVHAVMPGSPFWHPPSPTPPDVFMEFLKSCISIGLLITLVILATCVNHKFRKSEIELGITQS